MKQGLYSNIKNKRDRIAAGSGEKMRKKGDKGAPSSSAFADAKKTVKKAANGGEMKGPKSMMKKKGYAKGGAMKKKAGGVVKKKAGGAMMKKKGFAKGGAMMKKKGFAKGGAMMKKKGFAKGGVVKRKKK